EVPPELRVTPERDKRLAEQARSLSRTDAVRLLDLVSAALEATTNGAQPRIQLELVLVKGAAPELDPSRAALLARLEQLEAAEGSALTTAPSPAEPAVQPPASSLRTMPAGVGGGPAVAARAQTEPDPQPEPPASVTSPSAALDR